MGERRPRLTTTLLRRAGSAGLLLLAAGCTTDSGRDASKRDDPLLGIGPRPAYQAPVNQAPANQAPVVPTSNPTPASFGPPPAYQPQPPLTAATPTSNAAGGFQPLQGGSDLRIGAGAFPPPAGSVAQPVAGVTAVPPPGTPAAAPPPATPIGVPTAGGSLDQLYAAVTARNPLAYQMKFNSQTAEYTFQMKVPSRLNTAAIQSVEASAATPADAIRRTLEQLSN